MKFKQLDFHETDIRDEDFSAVLLCAQRYAIGRITYMPGLVTDWIMENCHKKITKNIMKIMVREITEEEDRQALGMECDYRTWLRFREWLQKELNECDGLD